MNFNEILEKDNSKEKEQNQSKELIDLLSQTRELNDLMRSYLKVQMDKDSINQQTVLKEIQAIERVSKQSQDQMISIVQQLENLSNNQLEKMQKVSESYLSQMQEQERLSERRLKNLNEQIVNNTKEGLNIVNQGVGAVNKSLKKGINDTFSQMNTTVEKLKQTIEYTDFKEKVKIAFPIAFMSSLMTLAVYLLVQYFL